MKLEVFYAFYVYALKMCGEFVVRSFGGFLFRDFFGLSYRSPGFCSRKVFLVSNYGLILPSVTSSPVF